MEFNDSPVRLLPRPRVLFDDNSPENSDNSSFEVQTKMNASPTESRGVQVASPCSPPYRKVRALRYAFRQCLLFTRLK